MSVDAMVLVVWEILVKGEWELRRNLKKRQGFNRNPALCGRIF